VGEKLSVWGAREVLSCVQGCCSTVCRGVFSWEGVWGGVGWFVGFFLVERFPCFLARSLKLSALVSGLLDVSLFP